jgi:small-conductance mechanosensitive channel
MISQVSDMLARIELAFGNMVQTLLDRSPSVLLAILVLLLGWGLARLSRWVVRRLSVIGRLESFSERVGLTPLLVQLKVRSIGDLIGLLVFWAVILGAVMVAAEVLGMAPVIRGIERLFGYLPKLLAAVAVFTFGYWLGDKLRFVLTAMGEAMGFTGAKAIGRILFVVILLFMSITALNVAGIDTTLITSNILIIVASLFISFSIAYGFAARDILSNILSGYYNKDRLQAGQYVRIGADEGVVERISGISITIRNGERLIHIPSSRLVTERIEVIEKLPPASASFDKEPAKARH